MKILKPKFWDINKISFFSIILLPFSLIYQLLIIIKIYLTKEINFSIPIICVGNIYIGGTGKTPLSIKIFQLLKELKMEPIVIKKDHKNQKDEILLLKKYCNVLVSRNRSDGILEAQKKGFNVVILDDGYQDFKIKKKINFICFNLKQKIGNGFTIPAGPLRQNLNSLKNAEMIFLNGKKDSYFEKQLKKYNSKLNYMYFEYTSKNLNKYQNDKLVVFAGIGNPKNFFDFLKENKLNIVKEISYPDHYCYTEKNLLYLNETAKSCGAKLITTEKDYLRILPRYQSNIEFVSIEANLEDNNFLKKYLQETIQ